MFLGRFLSWRVVMPVGPGAFCLNVFSERCSSQMVLGGSSTGWSLVRLPVLYGYMRCMLLLSWSCMVWFYVKVFVVCVVLCEYVLPVFTENGFFLFGSALLYVVVFEVWDSLFGVEAYHAF
jgi:hypothetical protein